MALVGEQYSPAAFDPRGLGCGTYDGILQPNVCEDLRDDECQRRSQKHREMYESFDSRAGYFLYYRATKIMVCPMDAEPGTPMRACMAQVVGTSSGRGNPAVLGTNNDLSGEGVRGTSNLGHGVHGINGGNSGLEPQFGAGCRGESLDG